MFLNKRFFPGNFNIGKEFCSLKKEWKYCKTNCRVWGVSIIGNGHISLGIPNQDNFYFGSFGSGKEKIFYASVADGLGSKDFSQIGSGVFCSVIRKLAKFYRKNSDVRPCDLAVYCQGLWSEAVRNVVDGNKKLNKKNEKNEKLLDKTLAETGGEEKSLKISDFSTTGLFVFLYKDKIVTGKIGDGCILGLYKDESFFVLKEQKDDSFGNITSCLGTSMKLEDWQVGIADANGLKALMICTDGISTDIDGKEADFLRGLVKEYENNSLTECINDAKNWIKQWPVKGNVDDKTIIMITANNL